jgi:hypothetical protein
MMWQMWTTFGMALGDLIDSVFYFISDPGVTGLNWRLTLGSAGIPGLIVLPASPICARVSLLVNLRGSLRGCFQGALSTSFLAHSGCS